MPVQVDGEPWIQAPGEVVILKSALKVCQAGCYTCIVLFVSVSSVDERVWKELEGQT